MTPTKEERPLMCKKESEFHPNFTLRSKTCSEV